MGFLLYRAKQNECVGFHRVRCNDFVVLVLVLYIFSLSITQASLLMKAMALDKVLRIMKTTYILILCLVVCLVIVTDKTHCKK